MGRKVTVATCALNQWALDFEGNLQRILKSKSAGGGVGGGVGGEGRKGWWGGVWEGNGGPGGGQGTRRGRG